MCSRCPVSAEADGEAWGASARGEASAGGEAGDCGWWFMVGGAECFSLLVLLLVLVLVLFILLVLFLFIVLVVLFLFIFFVCVMVVGVMD
jgi:hypothetical protein